MTDWRCVSGKIPAKLKPPLAWLYRQYECIQSCYGLRCYSRPVKAAVRFFLSHRSEIEAQMLPSFAAGLLQAVVDTDRLDGDIIECGTYKGGSTILIAHVLKIMKSRKRIYACDTFQGHPYDDIDSAVDHHRAGRGSDTSDSYVRSKFHKFGLEDRIIIVKGRFEDALPRELGDKTFSLAFLDCDLYRSAQFCYAFLYPRMVPGGCMVVHDYAEPGAERVFGICQATDEFLRERGLAVKRVGSAHLIWVP